MASNNSLKHPFDAGIPHITEWVKRKGSVSFSRNQHSFIQASTKDNHLIWADFGKYPDLDAAIFALNEFLEAWPTSKKPIEPTRIDGLSFLQNPQSLPFSIGNTHAEIEAVLGKPEEIYAPSTPIPSSTFDFDLWNYGELYIHFKEGRTIAFCLYDYSLKNSTFYPPNSNFQFQGIEEFHDDEDDWAEIFESLDLTFEIDDTADCPSYHFENGSWLVDFRKDPATNPCSNYYVGFGEYILPGFDNSLGQNTKMIDLDRSFLARTNFEKYFPICCSCVENGMTLTLNGQSKKIILTDQYRSHFNDAKLYPLSIGTKIHAMEARSKQFLPKRDTLNSTQITLSSFFKTGNFGPIELGMTKVQVLEAFGPPEVIANIPTDSGMMESIIWLYNSLEFYFYENEKPESAILHQISRSSLYYHYKDWADFDGNFGGLQIIPDITEKSDPPSLREVLAFAKTQGLNVYFQHFYEAQFKAIFDSGVFFMFILEDESDVSFDDALEKAINLPADYLGIYERDLYTFSKKPKIPFALK